MQGSLRALLTAEEPRLLPAGRAMEILSVVSDTLFPLHAAGRCYGPFGPASVLLDGGVTLADTPVPEEAYAAPELREGGAPSPATDAFAYATLAHLLLAGDLPEFAADGSAVPVTTTHPGFPAFAGEAIARALQPDPAARPLPKVLSTLLRVVPIERWPASAQTEPAPEPAAAEPAIVEPIASEAAVAEVPVAEPAPVVEPAPVENAAPAPAAPEAEAAETEHDWHGAIATAHDVPSIDWRADADPTRPSDQVPAIAWAADEPEEPEQTKPALDDRSDQEDEDPAYLHDFMHAMKASTEVPVIEPLDQAIPEEQMAHRPGRRVRRKRRERSPDRMQKLVLLMILLVLVAVGVVWALTHKDSPQYDPTLQGAGQGASRVLVHPSPSRS